MKIKLGTLVTLTSLGILPLMAQPTGIPTGDMKNGTSSNSSFSTADYPDAANPEFVQSSHSTKVASNQSSSKHTRRAARHKTSTKSKSSVNANSAGTSSGDLNNGSGQTNGAMGPAVH